MSFPFIGIEKIETMLVDVPTIRPHRLSVATMNCQTLVIVRVTCADGIVGCGEGTTIGGLAYGEESPESIKTNIDTYFAPLLKGMDASRPGAAMARVRDLFQGNRFAKCALETALFDAQARAEEAGLMSVDLAAFEDFDLHVELTRLLWAAVVVLAVVIYLGHLTAR